MDTKWLRRKGRQKTFEFIVISDAKSFTEEEFRDWTFYIPLERCECDWELYFVLLVEYDEAEDFYRRVALRKIFKKAFITRAEIQGLEDDFNSTIIFKVLTKSLRSTPSERTDLTG